MLVLTPTLLVNAQSIAINTDCGASSDAKAMLEIKKEDYSKLKIRTTSFSDTAVLEFSNRDMVGLNTDFLFNQIGESGLVLSSRSDLVANTNAPEGTFFAPGVGGVIGTANYEDDEKATVRELIAKFVIGHHWIFKAGFTLDLNGAIQYINLNAKDNNSFYNDNGDFRHISGTFGLHRI